MSLISNYRNRLSRFLVSLSSPEISSKRLALGFGVGTFIAVLPTPGFGILIGILLVFLFKKVNKFTMLFSFAVWNPLILTPIYILSYRIGEWTFDTEGLISKENAGLLANIAIYVRTYLFGNALLALVLAFISYFVVLKLADAYKHRRRIKRVSKAVRDKP